MIGWLAFEDGAAHTPLVLCGECSEPRDVAWKPKGAQDRDGGFAGGDAVESASAPRERSSAASAAAKRVAEAPAMRRMAVSHSRAAAVRGAANSTN